MIKIPNTIVWSNTISHLTKEGLSLWEMERKLALAMAVAMLTVIFRLQLMDTNITFIMVLMAMIFLDQRICSRLSHGADGKS